MPTNTPRGRHAEPSSIHIENKKTKMTKSALPPSRAGKKPVTAYVDKEIHRALRMLGVELDKSTQEMLSEAVWDYLKRHKD